MTLTSVTLIGGLSLGLEYIGAMPADDIPNSVVFDFFILRFIFTVS